MSISLQEIDRMDWAAYECGCGASAVHLGKDLREIITATEEDQVRRVELAGHMEDDAILFEVARVAVPIMVAALAEELHPVARGEIIVAIFKCLCAEDDNRINGVPTASCESAAYSGLWQFYKDASAGFWLAVRILFLIESDLGRLSAFIDSRDDLPEWLAEWKAAQAR